MRAGWLMLMVLGFLVAMAPVRPAPAAPPLGHVERHGSGPVDLVLIHALDGGGWTCWEPFMRRNAERCTMHAVTVAGMGGAGALEVPTPTGPFDTPWLDVVAEGVAEYLAREHIRNAVVLGHSTGAIIALKVALDHPARVSGIILEDFGAVHHLVMHRTPEQRLEIAATARAEVLEGPDENYYELRAVMLRHEIADPARAAVYEELMRRTSREVIAEFTRELRLTDLRPRLGDLEIPVLAIRGLPPNADQALHERFARELLDGADDLRFAWIADAGHWVHEDRPQAFDEAVRAFIAAEK